MSGGGTEDKRGYKINLSHTESSILIPKLIAPVFRQRKAARLRAAKKNSQAGILPLN